MTPILYKRTRTGAIQYWQITTSTAADGTSSIIKRSGQYGTDSPLEHVKDITEGKNIGRANATTPRQQAEAEALSQWKKKKDDGYKSMDDLGIEHHTKLHGGIHPELGWKHKAVFYKNFKEVLEAALPKYNSDANGNVKPMLAQSVNWKKVYYPCIVQPKYDGVRCLILFDGKVAQFLSRTGKEYTTLGHIKAEVETNLTEPIILDGEIYSHDLTFQEIVAAVKKQRDDSLKLQFRLYDVVSALGAQERQDKVQEIVCTMSWQHIYSAPTMKCTSQKEVMDLHVHYVSEGYEGVMIRLLENTGYEQGQRSSSLLKVKQYDSNEYLFMHFELGQRGVEDLIAVCSARDIDGVWNETFKAKMQGTVAEKQKLYDKPPHHGAFLTVKHHGFSNDGLPRFPIGVAFRDYE